MTLEEKQALYKIFKVKWLQIPFARSENRVTEDSFGLQLTPFQEIFFSWENLSVELVKLISFFNQLLSDIYFIGPYYQILPPETLLTLHLRMKWSVSHLHDSVLL